MPVPETAAGLRAFGATLLEEAGIDGTSFGTYRQSPTQVNVYCVLVLDVDAAEVLRDQKKLTVEDRRFRWDHFLTGMHARGGFEQESLLDRSWSVVVDLVCVAMVLWIASGLYMWWGSPDTVAGAGWRSSAARPPFSSSPCGSEKATRT